MKIGNQYSAKLTRNDIYEECEKHYQYRLKVFNVLEK